MTQALHITLAQINPIVGDLPYNLGKIGALWKDHGPRADIIVFPELALCGYPPEDLVLKPFFLQEVTKALHSIAEDSRDNPCWLAVGAPLQEGGATYNALYIIGDGRIQDIVRKRHLPNYGVFDEARVFTPAPLPEPVTVKGRKIGFMICEDMWKPDVSRALRDKGAEMLVVVNASPYEVVKHDQRLTQARDRATENTLPLLYVNLAGGQDELVFDGASFVMNEAGRIILQAEEFVEDIHHTVWDPTPTGHWLCSTDTIIPRHEPTEAVYQAVMIGLRDYVTKNGFSGVILGLSGGIDSALAAALAVDALGSQAVLGVMMPSRYTSADSFEDAAALAAHLGIHLETLSIETAVDAFEGVLAPHLTPQTPGITHENIQPRCRGLLLMALSNATGRMVLSTGNKSENAVGYCTLYGDMCGGFNPLKDLYKTQVYELAHWRNRHKPDHGFGPAGRVIPERSLTKAPTAELKPDQTDQDSLPPYDVLDGILENLIERDLSVADIVNQGYPRDMVLRVWRMVDAAEYKRRQAAPGVKITSRAFGRDRRYPVTNHFRVTE